jgi:ATP-dependent DNA helicase HFM1/MER3
VEPSFHEDREKIGADIRTTETTHSDAEPQATSQCFRRRPSRRQPQIDIQSNTINQPCPPPVFFKRNLNHALENQQTNPEMKTDNYTADVDVLAEFESWLESGAVNIV